jgi:hypothetical protein
VSRKPSKKPRPDPTAPAIITTKKSAAIGQLESAILLWFNEADPVSILVLASNAEDCFHALGARVGKPAFWKQWLKGVQPKFPSLWERANYIQDFAKHGAKDLDDRPRWVPEATSVVIISAVDCCQELYGIQGVTPLMRLFRLRIYSEHPEWLFEGEIRQKYITGAAVYGLGSGSRKQFFDEIRPVIADVP